MANFLRTLALPRAIADWSLTSLREKVVKIGAKVVTHGRYLVFQMAEVTVPRELFRGILDRIAGLRPSVVARCCLFGLVGIAASGAELRPEHPGSPPAGTARGPRALLHGLPARVRHQV